MHCIAIHCIVFYCIVSYYIALHCTALHCIALYCIALYCIVLRCPAPHHITLHHTSLHCTCHHTALYWIKSNFPWLFPDRDNSEESSTPPSPTNTLAPCLLTVQNGLVWSQHAKPKSASHSPVTLTLSPVKLHGNVEIGACSSLGQGMACTPFSLPTLT